VQDFREFLVALFSYCTADKTGLISFAFRLYDTDNSGMLDITEIQQLIREVYVLMWACERFPAVQR